MKITRLHNWPLVSLAEHRLIRKGKNPLGQNEYDPDRHDVQIGQVANALHGVDYEALKRSFQEKLRSRDTLIVSEVRELKAQLESVLEDKNIPLPEILHEDAKAWMYLAERAGLMPSETAIDTPSDKMAELRRLDAQINLKAAEARRATGETRMDLQRELAQLVMRRGHLKRELRSTGAEVPSRRVSFRDSEEAYKKQYPNAAPYQPEFPEESTTPPRVPVLERPAPGYRTGAETVLGDMGLDIRATERGMEVIRRDAVMTPPQTSQEANRNYRIAVQRAGMTSGAGPDMQIAEVAMANATMDRRAEFERSVRADRTREYMEANAREWAQFQRGFSERSEKEMAKKSEALRKPEARTDYILLQSGDRGWRYMIEGNRLFTRKKDGTSYAYLDEATMQWRAANAPIANVISAREQLKKL